MVYLIRGDMMKEKEPTIQEMIELFADAANNDEKCRLVAYPGNRIIIFKWRDPVKEAHRMKTGYDETEMFYVAATIGPKDTFRTKVRPSEMRKRTLREKVYIFLFGEFYVIRLFENLGYRYREPKDIRIWKWKRLGHNSGWRKMRGML